MAQAGNKQRQQRKIAEEEKKLDDLLKKQYHTLINAINGDEKPSVGLQKAAMFTFIVAQMVSRAKTKVRSWSELVALLD